MFEKKFMGKNISRVALAAVFAGLLAAGTAHAGTASLYFSPSSGSYHKGENFSVSVFVRSDTSINATEGVLMFPTRYVETIRVSKNSSIINFWIQEPSFSNAGETGNVSFEGVVLNPGFTGPAGKVLDITFRAKNEGIADLKFLRAAILANDGLGTNVTALNGGARFTLAAPSALPEPSREEGKAPEELPPQQVLVLKEVPRETAEGILKLWEILPRWIRVGILVLIGIATALLFLIFFSFGLIVLIYLWKYAWSRRERAAGKLTLWRKLARLWAAHASRALAAWIKMEEREVSGDIEYAARQLRKDFQEATSDRPPPFWQVVKDYWFSVGRIIKRFFTRNERKTKNEE